MSDGKIRNVNNQPWDRFRHPERYASEPERVRFACVVCGATFTANLPVPPLPSLSRTASTRRGRLRRLRCRKAR